MPHTFSAGPRRYQTLTLLSYLDKERLPIGLMASLLGAVARGPQVFAGARSELSYESICEAKVEPHQGADFGQIEAAATQPDQAADSYNGRRDSRLQTARSLSLCTDSGA